MGQPQESIPGQRDGEERQREKGIIDKVRQGVYAGIAALGLSAVVGCGGRDTSPQRVEVAGPGGGPIPVRIDHGEKGDGGISKAMEWGTKKKIEKIPPEIQMRLGENAVRLQNPVVVRHGKDIFLVDSDGQKLWRLVYGNALPWRKAEENRPFINEGVIYGTHVVVKYGQEVRGQLTTYGGMCIGQNGKPFVDTRWPRIWMAENRTVDDLKKRAEEESAYRIEQKKQETVKEQPSRFLQIVSVKGKTFTDQRNVVWTHAAGYFPSLSLGMIYDATMRVENPQWERDPRGSGYILVGGDQILRWKVEGKGYVEFRAPVERKKGGTRTPERPESGRARMA